MKTHPVSSNLLLKRLQTFDFLQGLDEASLNRLAQGAIWKVFAPDAVVFWEGDLEANLYFLQYGSLKILKKAPDGRTQVLRYISVGEIFNEVGVLTKRPNPATAVALEESGIWLMPRSALEGIVLAHPTVAMQIIENMADKIIELVTLAADLSLKTVEVRLIKILLEQTEGDTLERRGALKPGELAARLGTVPDVVGRVMRELAKAGLIEMDRQQIRILKRDELDARANPPAR